MAMASLSLEEFVKSAALHVRDGNNIVLFLGAGCSRSAGIPTASDLMDLWAQEGIARSSNYSTMLTARYPLPGARNKAFRVLCSGKEPTGGHHALAQLFASFPAQVRLCITSNFDGLVEAAVDQRNLQDGSQRYQRMHHQHTGSAAKALRRHLAQTNVFSVVKLHGDALSGTHKELDMLPVDLAEPVRMEFQKSPTILVFIGYGGNDNGVVNWLRQISVEVGGVYWCSQSEPQGLLAPWLREKRYQHVVHRDFDKIMTALAAYILPQLSPPVQPPQQQQQQQVPQDLVVCFVCARDEEAAALRALLKESEDAVWELVGSAEAICLERAVIRLGGQAMQVWLTFPMYQGPDHLHAWLAQLLRQPPWVPGSRVLFLLTGVCAGERGKCRLGDLMVATKAFNYQAGKRGADSVHQPAPDLHGPPDTFLRWLKLAMHADRTWEQPEAFPAGASDHDVLLRYLFARDKSRELESWMKEDNAAWLEHQGFRGDGPLLRGGLEGRFMLVLSDAIERGDVILQEDSTLRLSDTAHETVIESMQMFAEFPQSKLPYREPVVRYGVWGSGSAVRADFRAKQGAGITSKVFEECRRQHRQTIAVDMETAAFYQHLQSLGPEARFLAVKAVIDFADAHKDDSFHGYGKRLSAAYALAVVRAWAVSEVAGIEHFVTGGLQAIDNVGRHETIIQIPDNDSTSSTLRWRGEKIENTPNDLLHKLRENRGILRQLHVTYLDDEQALASLLEILPSCVSLVRLEFLNCPTLTRLPESLDQLGALTTLYLGSCRALQELPNSVLKLEALKTLDLSFCGSLTTLPESLGQPMLLTRLDLSWCGALTALPSWLGQVSTLEDLNLRGCVKLAGLHFSLDKLKALKILDLSECFSLAGLPNSLGMLTALTTLNPRVCRSLKGLPESLSQLPCLTTLDLSRCDALTELPELPETQGQLSMLTTLNMKLCLVLTALPEGLGKLSALRTLNLSGCRALIKLPDLRNLTGLTTLKLSECRSLSTLPESLAELSLKNFSASGCNLVFPPQSVADAGFRSVKRFLEDFARRSEDLTHDRVMLLGDGGAGKTTLAMALRLHADPVGYLSSMRTSLREKLKLWPLESMQNWLKSGLDPRDRCPGSSCEWCLGTATTTFNHFLSGSVDASSLRSSHCRACTRVARCLDFLISPLSASAATAPERFADRVSQVDDVPATLVDKLRKRPLEKWQAFLKLDKSQWKDEYGLSGVELFEVLDIIREAVEHPSGSQGPQSMFDILRFIPHVMTRGVELLAPFQSPPVTIWDFAGQLEFFPTHHFLLSSSNVIYTVVFDASYGYETSLQRLSHWLSFIASSLGQSNKAAFGDAPHQRQGIEVVLVATHTDSPHFKTQYEVRPGFMTTLIGELSAKFSPQLRIHQHVFCPAYEQPHGGQLQDYCALLTELATNKDRRLRHSLPASYIEVYKRISASRADSLASKHLPLLAQEALLSIMKDVGLEPEALGSLLPTLESYGFLKRLEKPQIHLLTDPVTWLTMVMGEFVSPLQTMMGPTISTSAQAIPALTLAEAASICNSRLELPDKQVAILMSVMCELDVCYEVPNSLGFVFPSLLPPLRKTENVVNLAIWSTADASRVLFGRRYMVLDGGFLPSTLPLLLHRRLHALADRVVCVRRDHFFLTLFDCSVMVRFNTAAVVIRSSSGRTACSIDIAVSADERSHSNACFALDRVVMELALECARPDGPCRSLRLTKHAFCRFNVASDAIYDLCWRESDEELGDLVWVDNLVCIPTSHLEQARLQLPVDLGSVWQVESRMMRIKPAAEALRSTWLLGIRTRKPPLAAAVLHKFDSLTADQIGSLLAAFEQPESEHLIFLSTDPFWVTEGLLTTAPRCLVDVPGRLGWISTAVNGVPAENGSDKVAVSNEVAGANGVAATATLQAGSLTGSDGESAKVWEKFLPILQDAGQNIRPNFDCKGKIKLEHNGKGLYVVFEFRKHIRGCWNPKIFYLDQTLDKM